MRRALFVSTVLTVAKANAEPTDFVARPLVLATGEIEGAVTLEVNLSKAATGVPLSLAPDVWVGITPRFTLGLVHSQRSVDQIGTGSSFCLRGTDLACDRIYEGSGLDARYSVLDGPLAVAPRVRLLLRDTDPVKPAVTLGTQARWTRGRFAITTDPYLRLGLANRDKGNRAALVVPLWFEIQPTCRWVVALHVGWDTDLAVIRDGWHVPVGLVVGVHPYKRLELGLEAGFPSLQGPQNEVKQRAMFVTAGWRQ